ncbi:hypothetical protein [Neisseria elongata]
MFRHGGFLVLSVGLFQTAFGNVGPSEKRILAVLTAEGRLANGLPLCCFSTCAEVMEKAALFAYCGLFVVM